MSEELRLVSQRQALAILGIGRVRFLRLGVPYVVCDPNTGQKLYSLAVIRAWQEGAATRGAA